MTTPSTLLRCLGLSTLLCLAVSKSSAQTTTWNHTGTDWNAAGSWTGGVPVLSGTAALGAGASVNPVINADSSLKYLNILATAGNYTFSGTGVLTFDLQSATSAPVLEVRASNSVQTFDGRYFVDNSTNPGVGPRFYITSGTNVTVNFSANSLLTLGENLIVQNSTGGSGFFNFSGTIANGTANITHQGGTVVTFRDTAVLTGSGQISNSLGVVNLESSNLGTGQITLGGSLTNAGEGGVAGAAGIYITKDNVTVSNRLRVASTSVGTTKSFGVNISGAGTATFSGSATLSENSTSNLNRTVRLYAGANDRAQFTGRLYTSDTGGATNTTTSVSIDGGGTVVFGFGSGANGNTYNINTTVVAGTTLLLNNSGANSATGGSNVSVDGILGGTGRMAPTGANSLVVNSGGSVAPGDGGIESLEVNLAGTTGSASFLTGSTFTFDLNAPGTSDTLVFTGLTASSSDVAFNGNVINFTNIGGLAPGLYTLMTFDASNAYTGTLSVGTGLGSYTGDLIYNADSIQLNVVPEPTVGLLLLGGVAGAALLRGRRVRRD